MVFIHITRIFHEIQEACISEKATDMMPAALCFINSFYYYSTYKSSMAYHFEEFRNFLTLFHVFLSL